MVRRQWEGKFMQTSWKKLWVSAAGGAVLLVLGGVSANAGSDEHKPNACGCYQKFDGSCVCGRGSKCGCPEECEPKGCEEKRQKEMDKEIQAETKKAQDNEKKRNEEAAAKVKAQEKTFVDDGEDEGSGVEAPEPAPAPKDNAKKSAAKQDKKQKKEVK
jgi:hypothetical protein